MTLHTCGAPVSAHPTSGYSEGGACMEALKAVKVMALCEWPDCGKRARKLDLGATLCPPHGRQEHGAFLSPGFGDDKGFHLSVVPIRIERVQSIRAAIAKAEGR